MLSEPYGKPVGAGCDLHSVRLDEEALRATADAALDVWLTDEDRYRARRFLQPALARRWRRTRAALRELLQVRFGEPVGRTPFEPGPAGKPGPAGGATWRFNVSHSHEAALIALGDAVEVGVDIERIDRERSLRPLLDTVCSARERAEFDDLDPSARADAFTRLWTRKEAVVKANGDGIGFGLTRIDVGLAELPRLFVDDAASPRDLLIDLDAPPGYRAALCRQRR